MSNDSTFRATQYLPHVAVATATVAVLPVVAVWVLLATAVVSSPWVCVGLAIVLSFAASALGSAYWKRRPGAGDILFSELLLWGWLHRLRCERRLVDAVGLLGLGGAAGRLPESAEAIERKSAVLRQMAAALDAQDSYTEGHSRRVALHAAMIARRMGLSRKEAVTIRTAAAVHDVGKLRTPHELLNKQGRLTEEEFAVLKRHAIDGAEIVACMDEPAITEMVRHHHESFDGSGYPAGIQGEQIPVGARVIAVADTFDALTSERPYRAAVSHKRAFDIIQAVSGSQLDPVAVRALLKCYSGKRAMLFWVLLAVSPQRALALLGGKSLGRISLGSAATGAMPAALAALVAGALSTSGTAAQLPLRFAQRPSVELGGLPPAAPSSHRTAPAHVSRLASRAHPHVKKAVLGVSASRAHSAVSSVSHSTSPATSGTGRHSSGALHRSVGSPSGPGPVAVLTHPVIGKPKPKPTPGHHGHPPASGGTPTPSPAPPASSPSGGGGNPTSGGNGGGGGSGGSGGGGGAGGSGGGGGGTPPPGPQTKQDCRDGGWANFSFPNQGQCVAFVEHNLHG